MSNSPKRLVLFDIDGTLLHGGPLWKQSFMGALGHYFPQLEFPKMPFCGKTDLQICHELMTKAGFEESVISESIHKVVELYIKNARVACQGRGDEVSVLPGVRELLDHLAKDDRVLLGLLTGNVRDGADLKLTCAGLAHYFKFGVFCNDNHDRYKLPTIAAQRALQQYGQDFSGKNIVIIGDTIHDVNCGKSIGVRSIAVGTGRNIPTEDLLAQNPDYYFHDLSATHEVWQAIIEDL